MRAITIEPGVANSIQLEERPQPVPQPHELLVRALSLGICGTDRELLAGNYGWAPPDNKRLLIGHESLGRVETVPPQCAFQTGDLVVGIVRRPDPLPCACCAIGEWDMCRNGAYTEHGIKQLDGFGAEWFALAPAAAVKLDAHLERVGVLLEPASIVAKAWEQIERIGRRSCWAPRTVLITGAGPIGLLAALLSSQRNYATHVLDIAQSGPKPDLVRALGATYHSGGIEQLGFEPDIVIECTGVSALVIAATRMVAAGGIVCLTGVSSGERQIAVDVGALNRAMVLENEVVFGSVNANRRHYQAAATALARADCNWLDRLITRRVPLANWREAFEPHRDDVKVAIDFMH